MRQLIVPLSINISNFVHCKKTILIVSSCQFHSLQNLPLKDNSHIWLFYDVVEAHAMVLNQTGTLLSNHVARGVNCSETFWFRGSLSVTKLFCDWQRPSRSKPLTAICLPCYVITQQRWRPCSVTVSNASSTALFLALEWQWRTQLDYGHSQKHYLNLYLGL